MRSVGHDDSSDYTARARIRDAAMRLFGQDGYNKTSIRRIAEEAGTSPALILHHFGSKDGLKAACDEAVINALFSDQADWTAPTPQIIGQMLAESDKYRSSIDYLSRMLVEPSEVGDKLFEQLLSVTKTYLMEQTALGVMHEFTDPDMTALYLTVFGLATLVMRDRFGKAMGCEPFSAEGLAKQTIPMLEMFTKGLYVDDNILQSAISALNAQSYPKEA